jgi:hypothetical protein
MRRNIIVAASPVRSATTNKELNPDNIAHLPKTGANPNKKADDRAARMPVLRLLLAVMNILSAVRLAAG